MLTDLLRHKVILCDLHLLFCKVTAHIDHLHTVLQSRLDGVDAVGCRDEENIRQVVVNVKIVIVERCVLLRIKGLKQSRRRIALEVAAELVDLIKHNHRIRCSRTVDSIEKTARKRAHISLSMSTDLRLIMNSTQSNSYIFSSKSPCNRLSETCLTHTRRAVKTKDRRLHVALEFENRKILNDSLLDLFKTIMILIKDLLSILQIKIII